MRAHSNHVQVPLALWPAAANDDRFVAVANDEPTECTEPAHPVEFRVYHAADLPEVLHRVEDLWTRIQMHPGLRIRVMKDAAMNQYMVLVRPVRALDSEGQTLLDALQDPGCYRWMQAQDDFHASGRALSPVSEISRVGEVLVLELTPMAQLARLAGDDGVWLVQGLLDRFGDMQRPQGAKVAPHAVTDAVHDASRFLEQMRSLNLEIEALNAGTLTRHPVFQEAVS